jgi:hypothetical protein
MLDHRYHPRRHEATDTHWLPGAGELRHLDDPPGCGDLDSSADARRRYLEGLGAACPGVDDDLDTVSNHALTVATGRGLQSAVGVGSRRRVQGLVRAGRLDSGGVAVGHDEPPEARGWGAVDLRVRRRRKRCDRGLVRDGQSV